MNTNINSEIIENLPNNVENITSLKIPFSLSKYILMLILPKCVIVHGEILTSTYMQIAFNINHQKKIENWKKNGCWMRSKTIATNTGYNARSINSAINKLESLELITITYKNNLRVIRLNNELLKTALDIEKLNKNIESKLLIGMNKTQAQKCFSSFRRLEEILSFKNPFSLNRLTKSIWFTDVKVLKKWVIQAEKIYKGSGLFFINNIASQAFNHIQSNGTDLLKCISEKDRAAAIGSSQSTMSRYINAYVQSGCITVHKSGINTPIEFSLNKDFLVDSKNIDKRVVVNDMVKMIKCPICQKELSDNRLLSVHISRVSDKKHKLLNMLRLQDKLADINKVYLDNKIYFDEIDGIEEPVKEKKIPRYESIATISCQGKKNCKECYRTWKLDFFDDCQEERKYVFMKEFKIKGNIISEKVTEQPKEEIKNIKKEDTVKPAKSPRKKPNFGPDTSPGLVAYFYSLSGGFSPNPAKESRLVKLALNKCVTPDGVRTTMRFLHRKGQVDLRFFNNASIREAHAELELMADAEKEGTEAYLVKMYYDGMGVKLNVSTIIKDVQRIKEIINIDSYETAKELVQYMINVKCPTLNFAMSKRNEVLAKRNQSVSFHQNPCFFDRDDSSYLKEDLAELRRKLKELDEKELEQGIAIARQLFMESKFAERYTHFEWAWRVGLPLDLEMFKIASEARKTKPLRVDVALNETKDPNKIQKIIKSREKFYNWFNKQQSIFESA